MTDLHAGGHGDLIISNQCLRLHYAAGECRLYAADAQLPFARWTVASATGLMEIVPVERGHFTHGHALVISQQGRPRRSLVELYPDIPFVLITTLRGPPSDAPQAFQRTTPFQAELDLSTATAALRGLGTGGLSTLDQGIASYAWLAIAHQTERYGVVAGWLTNETASGVVEVALAPPGAPAPLHLCAHSDYGSQANAVCDENGEVFALGWFADARLGLEAWAGAIARHQHIVLPAQPSGYCTWYDDVHGHAGDEVSLRTLCAFSCKHLTDYGFSFIQIDDEWQFGTRANGPRKDFTGHDPEGPYPSGMKVAADAIHSCGFAAGLWILPFGGTWDDPFFAEHQDWFVRRADDHLPYVTPWGGTSLDMTHAGARAHVHAVISRAVHEWGFNYLKLDGLYTGIATSHIYVNAAWKPDALGDALFHDPAISNIAAFRSGLRLIRAAAGAQTFILGCCIPQNMRTYAGAFGLVDAMRIGPDNSGDWASWLTASPGFGARHYFLNGRVWWNDPDPVYVRSSLTLDQARCIASWTALSGGLFVSSDWLPGLPAERLQILTSCLPAHGGWARPLDLFENHPPRIWTLADNRSSSARTIVGLFNWSDQPQSFGISATDLGLEPAIDHALFDFWSNDFLPPCSAQTSVMVAATSCRILAHRPLSEHPSVLSTSRHITQGMLDVINERWDATTSSLHGHSSIVADDAYEIRIAWSDADQAWTVLEALLDEPSGHARIHVDVRSMAGRLRVSIRSSASVGVDWTIRFRAPDV
jgi:hypothetical protein